MTITGSCHCGKNSFRADIDIPAQFTRRIGVNARLFDNFDAARAPMVAIDGKHRW